MVGMSCPYCEKSLAHTPLICKIFSAPITSFSGKYRFLSNFWPAKVVFEGVEYPSVENAYQAAKTLDLNERVAFQTATAGQAKKASHKLKIRPDWEEIKISVMEGLLCQKFSDIVLLKKLRSTENRLLVEGNTWHDNFGGDCSCGINLGCVKSGKNNLGQLLMKIRDNQP